jgi:hypothetical protein
LTIHFLTSGKLSSRAKPSTFLVAFAAPLGFAKRATAFAANIAATSAMLRAGGGVRKSLVQHRRLPMG